MKNALLIITFLLITTPAYAVTKDEVRKEIHAVFGSQGKNAVKVAFCESSLRTAVKNYNTNKTTDYGVFQINSIHTKTYGTGFKLDWKENIRVAHEIYKKQGWKPWVCRKAL